jgi:transcriptional regulator with PAS, ATPase and Fis domain
VAKVECNVLVLGESGTGKELVASAIHSLSRRASGPFIAINCAAIPEALLESELFGHAKGAFTGAVSDKKGLILEANGGVLFLDEIGDMSISLQAKLLRFIQERKIKPIGQNQFRNVDIRIIAATHRNLPQAIAQGTFREDLFYRLSVLPIELPALRDRKEDIPLLVTHFIKKFHASNSCEVTGITAKALEKLVMFKWEGNVRQLANIIEQAIVLSDTKIIDEQHVLINEDAHLSLLMQEGPESLFSKDVLTFTEMEKRGMIMALKKVSGNKERAAELLGISRKTFYRKELEYKISKNDVTI